MTTPCSKGPAIEAIKQEQNKLINEQGIQSTKLDRVLDSQVQLSSDIKQAIDGLTRIIMADIETRKDVEQLKKDREILFELHRIDSVQIAHINERNARIDGIGVMDNFPRLWNWYQQHEAADLADDITLTSLKTKIENVHSWYLGELGWRRFVPVTLAAVSTCLAIYIAFTNIHTTSAISNNKRATTYPTENHP